MRSRRFLLKYFASRLLRTSRDLRRARSLPPLASQFLTRSASDGALGDSFRVTYDFWNETEERGDGLATEQSILDMMGYRTKGGNKWYVP